MINKYKLIADFPYNPYKVGDILTDADIPYLDMYPHLFININWWEDTKPNNLPTYIKFYWNGKLDEVRKVENWLYQKEGDDSTPIIGFTHCITNWHVDIFPRVSITGWEPATEEEYNKWIKNKN